MNEYYLRKSISPGKKKAEEEEVGGRKPIIK